MKDSLLKKLPCVFADNPYYRSAAPMRLYLLTDVLQSIEDLDALKEKKRLREERSLKRMETILKKQTMRREELTNALEAVGLKLRTDSSLCDRYIQHGVKGGWTLEEVVNEMAFMKYLHEYTDYRAEVQQVVDDLSLYYKGVWKDASDYVKERYARPSQWPWLNI